MASTRVADLVHLSASCPVLSPSKRESPDKTSAESSHTDEEEIPRASKKQKLFARKLTQRDRKREKEQQKKHENNAISMDDFFRKQTEFRMWLTEEKKKKVGELRSPKLKAYFKTFIKLWNKKKLPQKYYRGMGGERPCTPVVTKFSLVENTPGKDLVLFPPALDLSLEQANSPDRPLSTFGKTSPETPDEEEKENTPTNNLLSSGQLSDSITVRRKRRNVPGSTPVKSGGSLYKVTQLSWNSQGQLHVKAVSPNNLPPSQEPCPSPSSAYTLPHHQTLTLPPSPALSTRSKRQVIRVATPTLPAGAAGLEKGMSAPATLPKPAWSGQKKIEAVEEGLSVAAVTENLWGTSADGGQSSSGVSSAGSSLSVASAESDLPPGTVRMSRVFVFPDQKTSHGSETSSGSSSECLASACNEGPTNSAASCRSTKRMGEMDAVQGTAAVQSTVWSHSATYTEIADRAPEKVVTPGAVRKLPLTPRTHHRTCSIAMGSAMLGASPETFASVAVTTAFERNTPARGSLIKTVPPRPSAKNTEVSSCGPDGPALPGPPAEGGLGETGSGTQPGQKTDLPLPPPPTSAYLASFTPQSPALAARVHNVRASPVISTVPPVLGPYADLEVVHGPEAGDPCSEMGRGPYAEPFDSCLGADSTPGSSSAVWNAANPSKSSHFSSFGKAVVKDHGAVQEIFIQGSSRSNKACGSGSAAGKFGGSNSKPTVPRTPPKPPLRTFGRESMKRRSPQQNPADSEVTDVYAAPMKKRQQNSGKEPLTPATSAPATSAAQVTSPPPPLPPKNKIYVIPRDITGSTLITTAQVHQVSEARANSVPSEATGRARPPCLPALLALSPSVLSSFPASPSEPTHFWMQVTPPSVKNPKEANTHTGAEASQMSPIIEVSPVVPLSSSAVPVGDRGMMTERRERQDSGKKEKAESREGKEYGNREKKELESKERKEGESREKREVPGKRTPPFSRDLAFVDKFLRRAAGALKTDKGKKTGSTPSPAYPPSSPEKTRQTDRQVNAPDTDQSTPTAPPPSTTLPSTTPPPLRGVLKYGLLSQKTDGKTSAASQDSGAPRGGGRLRVGTDDGTTTATTTSAAATDTSALVRGRRYHREQLERARQLREEEQKKREQKRRKLRRSISHDDLAGFPLLKLDTSPRQAWRETHLRLEKNKSTCTLID